MPVIGRVKTDSSLILSGLGNRPRASDISFVSILQRQINLFIESQACRHQVKFGWFAVLAGLNMT